GRAKIVDFGLARVDAATQLTKTGEVLGTPAFMAPEQVLGQRDRIGPASDVYALGALLYTALSATMPFEGANISDMFIKVTTSPPAPLRVNGQPAPPELEAIVRHCLEKEPGRRPRSA